MGSPCSLKGFCSICERYSYETLVFFSHRATQMNRFHKEGAETLSQPMTQSVTAKDGCWVMGVRCWWIDINLSPSIGVCGFSLFAERLLFNQWVLWEIIFPTNLLYSFSHRVTQKNRFHKGGTETLSQPIAQNVTANISYNALWYLSPSIGVCGFSLFAERLLFNLWVLWEISSPTNLLLPCCVKKTPYFPFLCVRLH